MKILAIQNRMGIGDMVIFLPFVEAISDNFNSPITLLVKESSKAKEYLKNNNVPPHSFHSMSIPRKPVS